MAILVTPLATVDMQANPAGVNLIGEVAQKVIRVSSNTLISYMQEQMSDPAKPGSLGQTINDINNKVTILQQDVQSVKTRQDTTDVAIGTINQSISDINSNIEQINEQLADIVGTGATGEVTLNGLNTRLTQAENTITQVSSNVSSISGKVSALEERIAALEKYSDMLATLYAG